MRTLVITLVGLPLLGLVSASAHAITVFRCTGSDGAVTFQDQPCPRGEQTRIIELPDVPSRPVAEEPATAIREEASEKSLPQQEPARVNPHPIASAIVCTREDGSRYLSASGRGDRQAVPLAMLGIPSQSLAEAYSGRDGIGVSAPGVRQPPTDASPAARAGSLYVWREDPCARLSGAPLCAYFDGGVIDAERRLRLAFSDTADGIRHELESLRERAAACRD